jgi:hypothetical protein
MVCCYMRLIVKSRLLMIAGLPAIKLAAKCLLMLLETFWKRLLFGNVLYYTYALQENCWNGGGVLVLV